jgi:hypothetical protein
MSIIDQWEALSVVGMRVTGGDGENGKGELAPPDDWQRNYLIRVLVLACCDLNEIDRHSERKPISSPVHMVHTVLDVFSIQRGVEAGSAR